LKRHMYLLEEYILTQKLVCPTHCFPLRTELMCEKNTPDMLEMSSGRNIFFMETCLTAEWKRHVSHENNTIWVGAGLPCTMLPFRIELTYKRNATYLSAFLSGRTFHFMEGSPILLNWGDIWISWKNTM
jgi:hypothetical protein